MYPIRPLYYILIITFSLAISCAETPTEDNTETIVIETKEDTLAQIVDPRSIDTVEIDTSPKPQKIERPSRTAAKMQFEKMTYHYDTIQQGDIIEYSFKFKNIGQRPLSISDVQGSCGCTIGSYPFLDIAANENNAIKARFDSKNKKGPQTTTITVYSNAVPKEYVLTLIGYVKE